jgi:hypothetical protein
MFGYNTQKVIDNLNRLIDSTQHMKSYLDGEMGPYSPHINHLFQLFQDKNNSQRLKVHILSKYVASVLGMKAGPETIKSLYRALKDDSNPSMDGWLLQMWFFSCLRSTGIKIHHENNSVEDFREANFISLDPTQPPFEKINSSSSPVWLKPQKWNQGGYDAVCFDKTNNLIKFFQVTIADDHSLKIECFRELMNKLSERIKNLKVEFYFLVPQHQYEVFDLGLVEGNSLLDKFEWDRKWKKCWIQDYYQ